MMMVLLLVDIVVVMLVKVVMAVDVDMVKSSWC